MKVKFVFRGLNSHITRDFSSIVTLIDFLEKFSSIHCKFVFGVLLYSLTELRSQSFRWYSDSMSLSYYVIDGVLRVHCLLK